MEKIVEDLMTVEQMANKIQEQTAKERAALPGRINDEIAVCTEKISQQTELTIKTLYKNADGEAEKKIKAIHEDARRGMKELETAFGKSRNKWRDTLVKQILKG